VSPIRGILSPTAANKIWWKTTGELQSNLHLVAMGEEQRDLCLASNKVHEGMAWSLQQ
jgi:hypothetical protein